MADEILAKLNAGDSFESLAKVYSEGKEAKEGGDWGWIGKDVLRKELSEVAFSLRPATQSSHRNCRWLLSAASGSREAGAHPPAHGSSRRDREAALAAATHQDAGKLGQATPRQSLRWIF